MMASDPGAMIEAAGVVPRASILARRIMSLVDDLLDSQLESDVDRIFDVVDALEKLALATILPPGAVVSSLAREAAIARVLAETTTVPTSWGMRDRVTIAELCPDDAAIIRGTP